MKKILIILLLLTAQSFAGSFYNIEFNLNSVNTDNLFNDSTNAKDFYSSIRSTANIYPIKNSELNVFAEYTNYGKNPNLSNITYGSGLTFLPLSDSSNFSLLFTGSFQKYSYKEALTTNSTEFVKQDISALAGFGYDVSKSIHLRTGVSWKSTGYASDDVPDKKLTEIFSGLNFTIFGSNSIDIESGYTYEKYNYLPEFKPLMFIVGTDTIYTDPMIYAINTDEDAYGNQKDADLNAFYFSTRFSRPLGKKTGLSLIYYYRDFNDIKDSTLVLGYSTGYLSPWVSSYDGFSIQGKLKTYLIPKTITTFGYGYWDKNHLRVVERHDGIVSTVNTQGRADSMRKLFLTIQFPIVLPSGRFVEPVLNVEFTNNNSTVDVYNYDDFTVSTGLTFRL